MKLPEYREQRLALYIEHRLIENWVFSLREAGWDFEMLMWVLRQMSGEQHLRLGRVLWAAWTLEYVGGVLE